MDQDWPWQYDFPPFFTIQPNAATRKIQLTVWCRSLPTEGISTVMESLMETGNAQPVDKSRSRWLIFWHNPTEWGDIIYSWAQHNGQIDSVCTLYELQTSNNTEFNGMPNEVLIVVLKSLEKKGSAELILDDDYQGVKFL